MKKLVLTIAIVLGLGMTTFANPDGGGLFQRGETTPESNAVFSNGNANPLLPNHGETGNQDANTPLGSGIAVLLGLGAAYMVGKRRKED
jgi:LPXTG-motif cell wall-anchored protein